MEAHVCLLPCYLYLICESNALSINPAQHMPSQQQQQQQQQTIDKHCKRDSTCSSSSDSDGKNTTDTDNDSDFDYSETRGNHEQQQDFEQNQPLINEIRTSKDQIHHSAYNKTPNIKANLNIRHKFTKILIRK